MVSENLKKTFEIKRWTLQDQLHYRKRGPRLGENGHHAADEGPAEKKAEPVIDSHPSARFENYFLRRRTVRKTIFN